MSVTLYGAHNDLTSTEMMIREILTNIISEKIEGREEALALLERRLSERNVAAKDFSLIVIAEHGHPITEAHFSGRVHGLVISVRVPDARRS